MLRTVSTVLLRITFLLPLINSHSDPVGLFPSRVAWSKQQGWHPQVQSTRQDQPRSQITLLDYHRTMSTYLWWAIVASFGPLKSLLSYYGVVRSHDRRHELNFGRMVFLTSGLAPKPFHFLSASKLNLNPCLSILRFIFFWRYRQWSLIIFFASVAGLIMCFKLVVAIPVASAFSVLFCVWYTMFHEQNK